LPEGAVFTVGQCGGAWHGTLMADGIEVSAETGTAHGAPEELTVHPGDTVEWTAQVVGEGRQFRPSPARTVSPRPRRRKSPPSPRPRSSAPRMRPPRSWPGPGRP
jgi:hypothetical protein